MHYDFIEIGTSYFQYETNYSYTPAAKIEKSRMAGQELKYNILFKDADTWLYKGDPPTFM